MSAKILPKKGGDLAGWRALLVLMCAFVPTLETTRLRLRPLAEADAAFAFELVNEPGWLRHIGDRGVRSVEEARLYLANGAIAMYEKRGHGLMAVERKADGVLVGICGLIKRDTMEDVDLGYALLARHEGQGYAREAAEASLAYGRDTLKLPRIVAVTAPANDRSIRLLEKLGFRFERMVDVRGDGEECRLFVYDPAAAPTERP